jgi:hypothetical protein
MIHALAVVGKNTKRVAGDNMRKLVVFFLVMFLAAYLDQHFPEEELPEPSAGG